MGRLSAGWRRFWGIRPGELARPVTMIRRGPALGEPRSGPRGRGRVERDRRRRNR